MPRQILIVDDEENIRKFLMLPFSRSGHDVFEAGTGDEARDLLVRQGPPDIMILDVRLPDANGIELLKEFLQKYPDLIIIIITAHSGVEDSVEAIKAGAYDYVSKPFEFAEINRRVTNAMDKLNLRDQLTRLRGEGGPGYAGMLGDSPGMREVFRVIDRVARSSNATVLITGETGSGKELVARAIHDKSDRAKGAFMAVNCATLHEQLLESELFGHERGAFTDAKTTKRGIFEVARGGTVFLDEIAEMDVKLQSKLLRVLEDRTFRMVGGTRDIQTDVRVVAATNRDLPERVKNGKFREDLYFRLRVVPIHVPPLRERGDDILLLAQCALARFAKELSRDVKGYTNEARDALMRYAWPGNVRELRNAIEHAVLLSDGQEIDIGDLGPEISQSAGGRASSPIVITEVGSAELRPFREAKDTVVARFEQKYLNDLLVQHEGNVSRAAAAAEMDRSSLQRLLRKHDISSDDYRNAESHQH